MQVDVHPQHGPLGAGAERRMEHSASGKLETLCLFLLCRARCAVENLVRNSAKRLIMRWLRGYADCTRAPTLTRFAVAIQLTYS